MSGYPPSRQAAYPPSFVRRHFLLSLIVYAGLYGWLRAEGSIEYMRVPVFSEGDSATQEVVAPPWKLSRWKRQAYRVVFSPLMVAEEEGRTLMRLFMERAPDAYGRLTRDGGGDAHDAEYPGPAYPAARPAAPVPADEGFYDFDRVAATLPDAPDTAAVPAVPEVRTVPEPAVGPGEASSWASPAAGMPPVWK